MNVFEHTTLALLHLLELQMNHYLLLVILQILLRAGCLFIYLFIVCIYQVYIVLYGEDGVSQTKELHVPGCTLFKRNSHDTFILR